MQEENQSSHAGVRQHTGRRWCLFFCHKCSYDAAVEQHARGLADAVLLIQKRFVLVAMETVKR